MNREFIRKETITKMEAIEERFHGYVPPEVQQYYLLLYLIVNGMRCYLESHGPYPLDKGDCTDGKDVCGFGPLSFFESDCVQYLSELVEEKERKNNKLMSRHPVTVYRG